MMSKERDIRDDIEESNFSILFATKTDLEPQKHNPQVIRAWKSVLMRYVLSKHQSKLSSQELISLDSKATDLFQTLKQREHTLNIIPFVLHHTSCTKILSIHSERSAGIYYLVSLRHNTATTILPRKDTYENIDLTCQCPCPAPCKHMILAERLLLNN